MARFILVLFSLTFSLGVSASTTVSQKISTVRYDALGSIVYFTGVEPWNDGDLCKNVQFVEIAQAVPGYKEILSIGMAAYLAGKSVQFLGSCSANGKHFYANYIIMSD